MEDDIFNGCGVEIKLPTEDSFLKVRETLTRVGVASYKDKTLYQSCHILHKRGRYRIMHFKELFKLDGKPANISEEDIGRRNAIVNLIEQWGLVEVDGDQNLSDNVVPLNQIKILPHSEKKNWELVQKYTIGVK
jgi:hypothetical protein